MMADVAYSIRRNTIKQSPNLLHTHKTSTLKGRKERPTLFVSPFAQLTPFAPENLLTANSAKLLSVIFSPIVTFSIPACVHSCVCIRVISSHGGFLSESNRKETDDERLNLI